MKRRPWSRLLFLLIAPAAMIAATACDEIEDLARYLPNQTPTQEQGPPPATPESLQPEPGRPTGPSTTVPVRDDTNNAPWQRLADKWADRYGVDRRLLKTVVDAETGGHNISGDKDDQGISHAFGYGQVWPRWHDARIRQAIREVTGEAVTTSDVQSLGQHILQNDDVSMATAALVVRDFWEQIGSPVDYSYTSYERFTRAYVGPKIPDHDLQRRWVIWQRYFGSPSEEPPWATEPEAPQPSTGAAEMQQQQQEVAARISGYTPATPATVNIGANVQLSVTLHNAGTEPWRFIAGATAWDSNGRPVADYSTSLAQPLPPGGETTVAWQHPVEREGEYWLQFGVWRARPFTTNNLLHKLPSPSERLIIVATEPAMRIGARIRVTKNLNVRTGPDLRQGEIAAPAYPGYAPAGTTGVILDGPVHADGYTWWKVEYAPGYTGWSVEDGLEGGSG